MHDGAEILFLKARRRLGCWERQPPSSLSFPHCPLSLSLSLSVRAKFPLVFPHRWARLQVFRPPLLQSPDRRSRSTPATTSASPPHSRGGDRRGEALGSLSGTGTVLLVNIWMLSHELLPLSSVNFLKAKWNLPPSLIGQCNGTFPSYFCKEAERAGNESFQSSERISWNLAYAVVHIIRNKKEGWGASERARACPLHSL